MTEFEDVEEYLESMRKRTVPSILPLQMVADYLEVSRAAVDQMLRTASSSRRLRFVRIGRQKFVDAQSLIELEDVWSADERIVRKYLEAKARAGKRSVFYEPVMDLIGRTPRIPADRSYIGEVLGGISDETSSENEILLTVLVHRKTSGRTRPGPGFFELAKKLGYVWGDDDQFVESETDKVLKYYKR